MNTIKLYLAESGRIADLHKDFPLYQGQFQDKLLNVFVPTSILAPQFDIQHYIGQMSGAIAPSTEELNAFVLANTYPQRESAQGDIIEFFNSTDIEFFLYTYNGTEWESAQVDSFGTLTSIAGTSVKIGMTAVKRNGSTVIHFLPPIGLLFAYPSKNSALFPFGGQNTYFCRNAKGFIKSSGWHYYSKRKTFSQANKRRWCVFSKIYRKKPGQTAQKFFPHGTKNSPAPYYKV